MKTKPPKPATSAVVNPEEKPVYDPLLYTKVYNNGHKFFMASEAKALTELLRTESNCRENFDHMKLKMVRPRNPLNGESTPRDVRGDVVLNPNAHGKVHNGMPLFSQKNHNESMEIASKFVQKGTVGKIGVKEGKYDILGNSGAFGGSVASQPEDLFALTKTQHSAKIAQQEERASINAFIAKEKAKRLEKDLAKQVITLKQQAAEKERELQFLRSTYSDERY